jgi:hypothetical protein
MDEPCPGNVLVKMPELYYIRLTESTAGSGAIWVLADSGVPQVSQGGVRMGKTTCPISRAQFRANAKPLTVSINNVPLQAVVKEFSTGSLGWYLNGKTTVEVDGEAVTVQIGLNLTIVGSKELPRDASEPQAGTSPEEAA